MGSNPSFNVEKWRPEVSDSLEKFDLQANEAGYVGLRIAPVYEAATQGGTYPVIPTEELLKNAQTQRHDDGTYARIRGVFTQQPYECEEHGLEERVDNRAAARFRYWIDPEMIAAARTRDVVLRNYNSRVIAKAQGIAHTQAVGNGAWSTSGATPIEDIRAAKITIRNRTGFVANRVAFDWETYEVLRDSPELIERMKYSGHLNPNRREVTIAALSQALDMDVVVSGAVTNTAAEPKAATLASMWDRTKALVYYADTSGSPDLQRPSFMRTFHWADDGSQIGTAFESYYDPARRSDIMRHRLDTDEVLTYEDLGQQITGVLA